MPPHRATVPGLARALERGARVFLRPLAASDRDAFVAAARASRALHASWVRAPSTTAAFDGYRARARDGRHDVLLVCRREDGALAGVVALNEIVRGAFQSAYLGYYAFAPHAGQGLMSEGLALAMRHAFTTLGLHRLEANVQPGNAPSLALAARCGLQREGFSPRYLKIAGRWRDHERWAITREDWRARRRPR